MATTPARTQTPAIDAFDLGVLPDGDAAADLVPDADLESVRYADLTVAELALTGARLDGVRLAGVSADEVDLSGARLTEVELEQVGFAVVGAARSQWRDVRVSGRLGSVEAYEAQWRSVHFVGCKLSFVNLRGAELQDVLFTDCIIEELDLVGASLHRVGFENSTITRLDVRDATLRDFDLRRAGLESIEGLGDLRGATLTPSQLTLLVPLLAEHLGLRVED